MDNAIDHYQAVLRDLELRRSRLQAEIAEIDGLIKGIKKVTSHEASLFVSSPVEVVSQKKLVLSEMMPHPLRNAPEFAGMSVRWAILKLLNSRSMEMPAADIAQALIDGGISSGKGKDFVSNVSAVLSDMKNKRGEVTNSTGKWAITNGGAQAWAAIQATPQYQNRLSAFLGSTFQ
jgi:hypothetical protein